MGEKHLEKFLKWGTILALLSLPVLLLLKRMKSEVEHEEQDEDNIFAEELYEGRYRVS
jgi:hypothetical protein